MSTLKSDAITAVTNDTDVTITGAGTGGVAIGTHMKLAKGGDIASASPLVIDTDGTMFDVTGTTNFSVMTVEANRFFVLQFDGALTVTDGSSIVLPGNANVTTAAGDVWTCYATSANTVIVTSIETTAAPASGGITFISSTTPSAVANINFTGFNASLYRGYFWLLSNVTTAVDNKELHMRTSTDGGVGYDTSGYAWAVHHAGDDGSGGFTGSASAAEMSITGQAVPQGTSTDDDISGRVDVFSPDATDVTRLSWLLTGLSDGGALNAVTGAGERQSAADVDAVQFIWESGGNFAAQGNISMYGITRS